MFAALATLGAALAVAAFAGRPKGLASLSETGRDGSIPPSEPITWDDVSIDDIKDLADETSAAPSSQLHRDAIGWLNGDKTNHEPTRKRLLAALNRERKAQLAALGRKMRGKEVSPCDADSDEPSGPVYDAWRCGDMCQPYEEVSRQLFRDSVEAATERNDYSIRRTPRAVLRIMAKQKRAAWSHLREQCAATFGWRAEPYRVGCCDRWRIRDGAGKVRGSNYKTEAEADMAIKTFDDVPF